MKTVKHKSVCATAGIFALALVPAAQASLSILSGPSIGSHVGNLVTNGSFEIGAPPPGAATYVIWPTGSLILGPHGMPTGWSSSGAASSYGYWGSDFASPPYRLRTSDVLPDGQVAMYFGNAVASVDQPPNFAHPDGTVTFPATPNFTPGTGAPVRLWQTVPTHTTPAPSYVLSFWASSEGAAGGSAGSAGIFGLKVTNVLAGDPITYLRAPGAGSRRYEFSFTPINPLAPVDVEFINWGHIDLSPYGGGIRTELVLDDVMVNALPEPASLALLLVGALGLRRQRPTA